MLLVFYLDKMKFHWLHYNLNTTDKDIEYWNNEIFHVLIL